MTEFVEKSQALASTTSQLMIHDVSLRAMDQESLVLLVQRLQHHVVDQQELIRKLLVGQTEEENSLLVNEQDEEETTNEKEDSNNSNKVTYDADEEEAFTSLVHREEEEEETAAAAATFSSLNIQDSLIRGLQEYGYDRPSELEQQVIPVMLANNKDLFVQMRSGSHKTSSYAISLLNMIDPSIKQCQAIVIVPTRELAGAILMNMMTPMSQFMDKNIKLHWCVGGGPLKEDIKTVKKGVQLIVGTPGRIADLMKRQVLDTKEVKWLVVDEADAIFDRSFRDIMYEIFNQIPETVNVGVFTCSSDEETMELVHGILKDPVQIMESNKAESAVSAPTKQFFTPIESEESKFYVLVNLLESLVNDTAQIIIFCNTTKKVEKLSEKLQQEADIPSMYCHGKLSTEERISVTKTLQNGGPCVLVVTDLLARGYGSLASVSFIINYEIPHDVETYLRRASYNRVQKGPSVINFMMRGDAKRMKAIENAYNFKFRKMPTNVNDF